MAQGALAPERTANNNKKEDDMLVLFKDEAKDAPAPTRAVL